MKYIFIGLAIVYIAVPFFLAMDSIDSVEDVLTEWWDAFKGFAPIVTAVIAIAVALGFIIYGLVNLVNEV